MGDGMLTRRAPAVPIRGVHLDLKGNPPTPERLLSLLDLFSRLRLNAVLAEWEDTLPWRRYPALRSPTAYRPEVVRRFMDRGASRGIEIIPLVQCFGHSENVLRLNRFRALRERPNDVAEFCPSNPGSARLVIELVEDALGIMGGRVRRFHLGGDEAWHMGTCARCRAAIRADGKDALYLRHVGPILDHLRRRGIRPILWDDMMRSWPDGALRELSRRADLMAWSYGAQPVGKSSGFLHEGHLAKYRRSGVTTWGASAYKGGDGPFPDVPDAAARIANNLAWARIARTHRMTGVIATAWSRYNTFMSPCETIEASLDQLVVMAAALWDGRLPGDPVSVARARLARISRTESRRFLGCRAVAAELQGWREGVEKWFLSEREQAAHLAGEPERVNPGAMASANGKIRRQLRSGARIGRNFIRAHRGLIPDRWLRLYVRSRIAPVERRFRHVLRDDRSV